MRLLLVADLHYSLPQFDWVLDMAPAFDVVVMAGDHLDIASIVDGRAQSVVVRKYFSSAQGADAAPDLLGQPRSRFQERHRREGGAMARPLAA